MNSFYGGPAGQSFEIKQIFSSYTALKADIEKGWKSNIAVGEFVMVSYGDPSTDEYVAARDVDLFNTNLSESERKNWNSTLWQKEYDEEDGSGTGISYRYISSCTGYTPRIGAEVVETLAPGKEAKAEIRDDEGYPDNVTIDLRIPGSWDFKNGMQVTTTVDVNASPAVMLTNIGTAGTGDYEQRAYYGQFTFSLPRAQNLLGIGVQVIDGEAHPELDILDADELPMAYVITTNEADVDGYYIIKSYDDNGNPVYDTTLYTPTINTPILRVKIPRSQDIVRDINVTWAAPSVATENIDAWLDKTDVNNPILNITIPKAWQFALGDTTFVDPNIDPSVQMADDGETKTLTFTLPYASKFYQASTLPIVDNTYHNGDIVIVTSTNEIFQLDNNEWVLKGTLLPAFKDATAEGINPYDADTKEPVTPTVELEQETDGSWSLSFGLPKMPTAEVLGTTTLGPAENATAGVEVSGADKLGFRFGIPRGSRVYSQATEPANMAIGDYWLNTDTGDLYEYKTSGKEAVANLVGPVGAALNFVADLGELPSIDAAIAVLDTNYPNATADQLYSANIADDAGNIAYWFYKTADQVGVAGEWSYSQLTGAVDSFIAREYVESDDKAYSATYINSLIEGTDTETGEKKIYSQAKIDELLSALDETLNTWGRFADLPDMTTT